ncbi:MAG TPA: glycosyltransferase, partial [Puia sp.]
PSETAAMLIRPKLNVKVIPVSSGIDLKMFNPYGDTQNIRKKYGIPNKPVLLFVGRLDPEKKIEEILHAVSLTLKKIDFSFVIIGRGVKKSALERYAQKLGIADHVLFTGFVPDEDLPFLYKLGRCFIIASIAELLSLSALQGMASGLPIIAVNKGALSELVHDKINGYLFESGDIQKMVQSIYDIIDKDDIYKKMSERSLEYIRKHDIQETADSFEKLYQTNCLS